MKREITLTEQDDGTWSISEVTPTSMWPTIDKPDSRSMVARLMQLVDVGPVAPQTEPERVGLDGSIQDSVPRDGEATGTESGASQAEGRARDAASPEAAPNGPSPASKVNPEPGHHPYKADVAGYCMVCGSGTCADEGFRLLREKASRTQTASDKVEAAITDIMGVLGWDVKGDRERHPEEHAEDRALLRNILEGLLSQAPAVSEVEVWKDRTNINGQIAWRYQDVLERIVAAGPTYGEAAERTVEMARVALHAKVSRPAFPAIDWVKNEPDLTFEDGSVFLVALQVSHKGGPAKWEFDFVRVVCDGDGMYLIDKDRDDYSDWHWSDFEFYAVLEGPAPWKASDDQKKPL